jgi:small GTP-binding protein
MAEGRNLKVIVVGDTRVGKSSIIQRYDTGMFQSGLFPTIAGAACQRPLRGDSRTLDIWDTAGQEQYRVLAPIYFRGASSVILIYDVTNRDSFASLPSWQDTIVQTCGGDVRLYLVGNKTDLEAERQIASEEGHEFSVAINAESFCECSALSGVGVDEIFLQIAEDLGVHLLDRDVGTPLDALVEAAADRAPSSTREPGVVLGAETDVERNSPCC